MEHAGDVRARGAVRERATTRQCAARYPEGFTHWEMLSARERSAGAIGREESRQYLRGLQPVAGCSGGTSGCGVALHAGNPAFGKAVAAGMYLADLDRVDDDRPVACG